jgi:hypothetical protein
MHHFDFAYSPSKDLSILLSASQYGDLVAYYPFNLEVPMMQWSSSQWSEWCDMTTDRFGNINKTYELLGNAYIEIPVRIL